MQSRKPVMSTTLRRRALDATAASVRNGRLTDKQRSAIGEALWEGAVTAAELHAREQMERGQLQLDLDHV